VAGLALCASAYGVAAGGTGAEGSAACKAGLQAYYARYGYPSTAGGKRAYKSAIEAAKAYAEAARLRPYYARYGYPSTAGGEHAYQSAVAAAKAYSDSVGLRAYYAKYGYPSTAGGEHAYQSAVAAAKAYAESYVPPPAGCGPRPGKPKG
jgi:hypothetical protein